MIVRHGRLLATLALSALCLISLSSAPLAQARQARGGGGTAFTVVASGLDHPKGLAFAQNGDLYVAESGHSDGTCPPPTPTQATTSQGFTSSVARITPGGTVTRIVTSLPSTCDVGDYIGASGVAFVGNTLYVAQGSCLGQYPPPAQPCNISQPVLEMAPNGVFSPIVAFQSLGNGDKPNVPDEDPYGIAAGPDGNLYVSDGADNAIWKVNPKKFPPVTTGSAPAISKTLVQFPGDPTLAGLAVDGSDNVYVALFGKAPFLPNTGKIGRVTPDGKFSYVLSGLYTPIAVAISPAGNLYVLQYSQAFVLKPFPHFLPNTGKVWRVTSGGALVPVLAGLNYPTGMTFGPHGNLYITNNGTGPLPVATGQVVMAYVGP